MDWLRSGYQTEMYSFDPATGTLVPFSVVWSKAPAGAAVFPTRHQYASANWTRGRAYPEQIGEILTAARPWRNGATPPGLTGVNHCGTQWTGELMRLSTLEPSNPFDQPACCTAPNLCQPFNGVRPKLDQGDGLGPVNMTVLSPNVLYALGISGVPGHRWLCSIQSSACLGRAKRCVLGAGTGSAFSNLCGCYNLAGASPPDIGSWYNPLSSLYAPGRLLTLYS